ncbi:IS1595 family transposase [Rhizobium leguminosarum bv. viciae]|nr:IS1595 family transposase [Rhizobium leguminosarum bv. viciae]
MTWSLSEDEASGLFCSFRWSGDDRKPFCPRCEEKEPYAIRRRRFRCSDAGCIREFSVTSGTVFHSRKLSFKKLLIAIREEVGAVKGLAALPGGEK